ncbi:B12-binding domain-containing radical SAM protein [bacterium]|nr:B12-binding domain-containing radical SAM protein [bacterium]
MKILLISPKYENTFWNVKEVLKIVGKKTAYPPLALLTIGAMLPKEWEKKLVDLNCEKLKDEQIKWADYVFISAIVGQKESTKKVINIVQKMGKIVVAGGSVFTTGWEEFSNADSIVLGEAEDIFPELLEDLKNGTPKKLYSCDKYPDIKKTPIPDWNLVRLSNYNSVCIQLSRGCPFNCEFCDVVHLNGRIPRTKSKKQIIAELDSLYNLGWYGGVFFVDDNFIGNKAILKKEYLPAIIEWQQKRKYPFTLSTQVSINLADDSELMKLMINAGFSTVFIGIETPDPDGLEECGKFQNKNRNLVKSVKKIQNAGFEVNAGFILGFDSDKASIFQNQIEFIQKSGIVTAMVGLLNVSPKTRLYERLKKTNRLIEKKPGNENELSVLNFIPKMDPDELIEGYSKVITTIYSPEYFYKRVKTFLTEFQPTKLKTPKIRFYYIRALFSSIFLLGLIKSGRHYYWNLFFWSLFNKPGLFPYAVGLPLGLLHFRKLAWVQQYYSYYRNI